MQHSSQMHTHGLRVQAAPLPTGRVAAPPIRCSQPKLLRKFRRRSSIKRISMVNAFILQSFGRLAVHSVQGWRRDETLKKKTLVYMKEGKECGSLRHRHAQRRELQLLSGRGAGLQKREDGGKWQQPLGDRRSAAGQPARVRPSDLEVGLESDGDSSSVGEHGNEQLEKKS